MYSYEDRIRTGELYIKLGKRDADHSSAGLPNQECPEGLAPRIRAVARLPVGYAGRVPKYSQAQKEVAAEHYLTDGRCIAATMRALG